MGTPTAPVRTSRRGPALVVELDRPERRNALDEQVVDALLGVLDEHRDDPCILVLASSTPGMFVSGADIGELRDRGTEDALRRINVRLFDRLEEHRWPTIAAVDGYALGGGCELALACDFRVATPTARFGQPEPSLGILAGAGANWRLPQVVGLQAARRIILAGELVRGDEAVRLGLVDELHDADDLLDGALALADRIAARSWQAVELSKLALRQHRPATTGFDVAAQALLFASEDKRDRMTAFLERKRS